MSDTPRTDAVEVNQWGSTGHYPEGFGTIYNLARTLERELAESERTEADAIQRLMLERRAWAEERDRNASYAEGLKELLRDAVCPVTGCDSGVIYEGRQNNPERRPIGPCEWCKAVEAALAAPSVPSLGEAAYLDPNNRLDWKDAPSVAQSPGPLLIQGGWRQVRICKTCGKEWGEGHKCGYGEHQFAAGTAGHSTFKCPKCGGFKWGTDMSKPKPEWVGSCHGYVALDQGIGACGFTWPRSEDAKYFRDREPA